MNPLGRATNGRQRRRQGMEGNIRTIGRRKRAIVTLLGVLVGCAALASSALASQRPSVSWSLPHSADEGAAITFSWTGHHLGRGHRLVIQKPEGTAHTWRNVMKLPTNSGSAELPGLPLGEYRYRIADLSGHRVLAQQAAGVAVFGQVPFSTLFSGENLNEVATYPGFTFPYVTYQNELSPNDTIFQVEKNHCESVHVAFVPSATESGGSLVLVQESRESITASAANNAIGSLDAHLTPGQSWAVNSGSYENIHLNGYAICDSTESFFS
jgi:hypothetical protein